MQKILCHISIILSGTFIVFLILDILNPLMNFANNSFSTILLAIFCVVSIVNSILSIILINKNKKL